ncbi:hypothetical protein JOF36_007668 [Pseudonocardia parietis]|uniref:Uncharacterized protein n=1 Tax=Pseudonocardia parietis TaxID=570936 RepID=A0ABS4W6R4_9PSEU|nr:hypothetical protein [Pseudonocardia parietis]
MFKVQAGMDKGAPGPDGVPADLFGPVRAWDGADPRHDRQTVATKYAQPVFGSERRTVEETFPGASQVLACIQVDGDGRWKPEPEHGESLQRGRQEQGARSGWPGEDPSDRNAATVHEHRSLEA